MAVFEITAKHQMNLGAGKYIAKGESHQINIPGNVKSFGAFSTSERRQQAIRQLSATGGIDLKQNSPFLNTGHWDIKEVRPRRFARAEMGASSPFAEIKSPMREIPKNKEVIDVAEMKKGCVDIVRDFCNEGKVEEFKESDLEQRAEIVLELFDKVKEQMGIGDVELNFTENKDCGSYEFDPETNKHTIKLNRDYLENPDCCKDLTETILHESRHAFQEKAVSAPDSVTVKREDINSWKDNMDYYIEPEYDLQAYWDQPIEKDAEGFAKSVVAEGWC